MEGGLCPGPGLRDHPGRAGAGGGEEEEEREGLNPGAARRESGSWGGGKGFVPRLFKRGRAGPAGPALVREGAGSDLLLPRPGRLRGGSVPRPPPGREGAPGPTAGLRRGTSSFRPPVWPCQQPSPGIPPRAWLEFRRVCFVLSR